MQAEVFTSSDLCETSGTTQSDVSVVLASGKASESAESRIKERATTDRDAETQRPEQNDALNAIGIAIGNIPGDTPIALGTCRAVAGSRYCSAISATMMWPSRP
jgi:hypothetical protein